MIAAIAIAIAEDPLFTANPGDYEGLDGLLTVVPVTRPAVLHDREKLLSYPLPGAWGVAPPSQAFSSVDDAPLRVAYLLRLGSEGTTPHALVRNG